MIYHQVSLLLMYIRNRGYELLLRDIEELERYRYQFVVPLRDHLGGEEYKVILQVLELLRQTVKERELT